MRTYSESEIADILARAAERQAEASRTSSRAGLTLDEIVRVGADAGLDADALRAAAAEVDGAGQTLRRQTTQTKTEVVVERWLDGKMTPEGWEDTVIELQQAVGPDMAGMMGIPTSPQQQIGRAFEWRHMSGYGVQTTVLASPRNDRTRLRLTQLLGFASPAASGVVYGITLGVIAAFVALIAANAAGASVALVAMVIVAAFGLATAAAIPTTTALDRRWRARKLDALDALADRVAPVLVPPSALTEPVPGEPVPEMFVPEMSVPEALPPAPSPLDAGRLDAGRLDAGLLDATEPDPSGAADGRARTRA